MAWGIRCLRDVVRCFSVPPLVGIGAGFWWWGWFRALIVPPLFTRESLAGAVGCLCGGVWVRYVRDAHMRTHPCPTYMCTHLRKNAKTCGRLRYGRTPVCVRARFGCARVRPLMYIIPIPIISQQLSVEGECLRNFEQNRGPWKPSTLRLVQDCPCKRLVIHCSLGAMDYKLLFSTYFVSTV
jgi:hypothetical protein